MADLAVIVQTCPERRDDAQATLASLDDSDVGHVEVMEHPEGVERCRFYRTVLRRMAEVDAEYVIRCEDDILVNRHLRYNFMAWPALGHEAFGAGWLYVSQMAVRDAATTARLDGFLVRDTPVMYGALCVGMPRSHARACLDLLDEKIERYGCPLSKCAPNRACSHATAPLEDPHEHGQDTLISQAMWRMGKRVFFHLPALAENRLIESVRGTPPVGDSRHLQAGPYFDAEWSR